VPQIGFVLPFAGPAASKIKGGTGEEGEERYVNELRDN
jgi:hypothetical protein